jgi:hypothetical protein
MVSPAFSHRVLLVLIFSSFFNSAESSTFLSKDHRPLSTFSAEELRALTKNGVVRVGDMLFDAKQIRTKASFRRLWPNGRIYYSFSSEVTGGQRSNFLLACNTWTLATPLTCIQRTTEPNYILVHTHNGNQCGGPGASCSFVGMKGGKQDLWIYSTAWNFLSVVQHELGHAIGLIHEHQRADRDDYIYVIKENILPGNEADIIPKEGGTPFTEYDYVSVMHYDSCYASKYYDCSESPPITPAYFTLLAKACSLDVVGGLDISPLDRDGVRNAYAPALQALLTRERGSSCGHLNYLPAQLNKVCPLCAQSTPVSYRKVDEVKDSWCGFAPVVYPPGYCVPRKKDYISHHWDTDDFSCGSLGVETRTELWVYCGCPVQNVLAECTNIDKISVKSSGDPNLSRKNRWRASRLLYFDSIVHELQSQNFLKQDVLEKLGEFYQDNYLDPKFETKMARARAGVYSYAKWKKSLDATYDLGLDTFRKIAKYRHLRSPE